jgi:hypothetical protein
MVEGKKIITYVKDEGSNLNVMIIALKVVKCESLGFKKSFQGTCFRHVFSKTCQYGTTKEKVCKDLKYVSIKYVQANLQKCIIGLKCFGKARHEWNKASIEMGIRPKKLNTLMKTT